MLYDVDQLLSAAIVARQSVHICMHGMSNLFDGQSIEAMSHLNRCNVSIFINIPRLLLCSLLYRVAGGLQSNRVRPCKGRGKAL